MTGDHAIQPLRTGDPQWLGGYRIIGRIGRGGMGTVYLAESPGGERAAIKVINPDLADDETFRERFRREVESARRVRRFCTAPVLDARLDGDPLFIVTEFVDGPNLDQFVQASGPMRGSSLEHLAVGVATALTAIHGAGVVHRDLKPANVLLSSVGPRVIDFGIARALDTVSGATRTGQFIGTPAYMAPELISGGTASPASDVFAWGCVVAYAGTGRVPFEAATVPAVLYKISHDEPSLDGLDEGIRELVEQALAKDPQKRPTAQELLDRLTGRQGADSAQAAETIGRTWAVPVDRVTRPDAPPTRTGAAPTRQGAAPTRALPGRRGGGAASAVRRRWPLVVAGVAGILALGIGGLVLFSGPPDPPAKTARVFSDDFTSNESGWSGSTWTSWSGYYNGGYRIDAGDIYPIRAEAAPVKGELPTRLLVGADASVLGGPDYGMLGVYCRGDGEGDDWAVYQFLVRVDGKGVLIRKAAGKSGAKSLVNGTSAPGFRRGKKNRLQAACEQQGDHKVRLRFWINGRLAAETSDGDAPLANGDSGLIAVRENGGSGGNLQVLFDDFDLSQIR